MSQLINTLSNQDFAGLNKFRLRESLGKMKEMRLKMNRINRSNTNKSSTSDFFSSPFSPVKLCLEHVFLSYFYMVCLSWFTLSYSLLSLLV